jgi:hypothetical protein
MGIRLGVALIPAVAVIRDLALVRIAALPARDLAQILETDQGFLAELKLPGLLLLHVSLSFFKIGGALAP